ncbi:hypothetical protein [Segetibacter sp.]|jgi:hypothetical protein|uniref:hypothetical protein n=1 Tax=Segetibacter sp. TaxID=2231182 RepID=UPI00262BA23B|nr:hypothetical protein [Segetibacter sp.]MCW3080276.1 hypothetical protein [Segetibacter sp.]
MKNVLLPTDLTVQSLRPVHKIVEGANGEPVTVFIAHLIGPPTSITDLLFIGQGKPYHKVPVSFKEAVQLLRNKYVGLVTIVFDFVYCNTSRYFNNFIEGHHINEVYMLDNYKYKNSLPQSENPVLHINKCKAQLHKLSLHEEATLDYLNLSSLLNGHEQMNSQEHNTSGKRAISYS